LVHACVLQALMLQLPGVMELLPQMDEPDPQLLWMVREQMLVTAAVA
jgi:hypothetical protein